jgi:MFS family permease
MADEIQKFTKLTFLIHLVLGLIFTVMYWIPEISAPLFGLTYTAQSGALSMIIGAATAGLTATSLFGYVSQEWKEVKIVVINEIVWLAGSLIALIINVTVFGLSSILLFIVVIALLLLFLLSFLQQEEIIGELIK